MDKDLQEAFYEVDAVLNGIPKSLLEKIPVDFRNVIKENKSTKYQKQISGLNDIKYLKKESRVILYCIYRDFLCSEKERKEMEEKENKLNEEKYSYENLFKKNNATNIIEQNNFIEQTDNLEMVEYKKEKWYMKIINFIKNIK